MMEYTKPVFVQFLKSDSKLIRLNFGLTIMKMYRCLLNGISKYSPFYNCHGRAESNIAYSLTRIYLYQIVSLALHWRHSDHDGVSNHQLHDYLLNRLFGRRSKKASKLWIPRTKGQLRGKCFHLMTSSWGRMATNSQLIVKSIGFHWAGLATWSYSRHDDSIVAFYIISGYPWSIPWTQTFRGSNLHNCIPHV